VTRITLDDLAVTSFVTDAPADLNTMAATGVRGCICTGDISTCSRTSPQGGCDTSVQCVTG